MAYNEDLIKLVQDIRRMIDEARAGIEGLLQGLPPIFEFLRAPILDGLNELTRKAQEFLDLVDRILLAPGLESALRDAAERWRTQVAIPARDLAGILAPHVLQVDDYLKGAAGHAYAETARSEAAFLTSVEDTANAIRTTLTAMATDVSNFVAAFGGAVIGVEVALVSLLAAVAVPPTAPAALGVAAAALGLAVATIVPAAIQLTASMNSAREQQEALQQAIDSGLDPASPDEALGDPLAWTYEES